VNIYKGGDYGVRMGEPMVHRQPERLADILHEVVNMDGFTHEERYGINGKVNGVEFKGIEAIFQEIIDEGYDTLHDERKQWHFYEHYKRQLSREIFTHDGYIEAMRGLTYLLGF
jgi:hypothetical protein